VPKPAAESDNSSTAGPNVEAITNPTPAVREIFILRNFLFHNHNQIILQATEVKPAVKSLIGQRKPAAKKPGVN
jgi:hypothetical protein